MKKTLKATALLLVFLLGTMLVLSSCDKIFPQNGDEYQTEELKAPDYSDIILSEHITLGEYKGLQVAVGGVMSENMTNDLLLWEAIVTGAVVIKYPEVALSYYEEQTTRLYMSYAEEGNMSYDELMATLGKTAEDIEAEAKEYVKSDLVKLAIIEAEKLDVSNGKPKLHVKKKGESLTIKCELTERATKDNAFLEGTYFKGRITERDGVTAVKGIILTAPIYHLFLIALTVFFIARCIALGGFAPTPVVLIGFSLLMFRGEFKKQGIIKHFIFRALKMTYAELNPKRRRENHDE